MSRSARSRNRSTPWPSRRDRNATVRAVAGTVLAASAAVAWRRRRGIDLSERVVLITGGSRGLGLALARQFASERAAVAVCARNDEQVEEAAAELRASGVQAEGYACDVRDPEQVAATIDAVVERFGHLDVLVNNAGTIQVGPFDSQTGDDFREALDTMFWGVYHPTIAALPHLRGRPGSRIVNITSIGGKLAAPHLLPYSVGKFAAVGFSQGLRAELAGEDVAVTTVVPGLMRTGSHVNAVFKGDHAAEYRWFSLAATLPITSTSAEHAARRIVAAARRGDAEVILTWQAHLAVRAHGLAPGLVTRATGLVERLLPDAPAGGGWWRMLGRDTGAQPDPDSPLARRAVRRFRQDTRSDGVSAPDEG